MLSWRRPPGPCHARTMDSSVGFPALFLVFGIIGVASFILWLWSLIHCINNRYLSDQNSLIGSLLIVLAGIIGSLVYLFLPRESTPQR